MPCRMKPLLYAIYLSLLALLLAILLPFLWDRLQILSIIIGLPVAAAAVDHFLFDGRFFSQHR